jgi:putative DNA primase/helicase
MNKDISSARLGQVTSPSSNGHSNGHPDIPESLDEWQFVVVNRADRAVLSACHPDWIHVSVKTRAMLRTLKDRKVIVVTPECGDDVVKAKIAADQLTPIAEGVITWIVPGLGSEETPDLKTFDEKVGLAEVLSVMQPWSEYWNEPLAGANGNGRHYSVPIEPAVIKRRARLTRVSSIKVQEIEWLWKPRLPLGMLSLLAGDPKLGKSLTTIGLGAAISRGLALPMDKTERAAASVIFMSAEDDPSRVIAPRLRAAGADLDRVHILESIVVQGGASKNGEPELPDVEMLPSIMASDIEAIEREAKQLGDCRLIIIDPVTAYLPGVDDHKSTEVRGALWPLKSMAERLNAAVVLVTHMSKGGATNAKYKVLGSIAYVGTCRANFLFIKDGNDPTGRKVLMCDNGCNLAAQVETLSYTVEEKDGAPVVAWDTEPSPITADEAIQALNRDPEQRAQRRESDQWLLEKLKDGPILASEIESAAEDAGVSFAYLKKAKNRLGVKSEKDGFDKSKWRWFLPKSKKPDVQ